MKISRLVSVLGLLLFGLSQNAFAQSGPPSDLCSWVLNELAMDQWRQKDSAQKLLEEKTQLLDIFYGRAKIDNPDAPYRDFYKHSGQDTPKTLDFSTLDRNRLPANPVGCVQLDGKISSRDNTVEVKYENQSDLHATIFVYENGEKLPDGDEDKIFIQAAELFLEDALGKDGRSDLMSKFYVSAYVNGQKGATIVGPVDEFGQHTGSGESAWFEADIGKGPQLIGVICSTRCNTVMSDTSAVPTFPSVAGLSNGSDAEPPQPAPDFKVVRLLVMGAGTEVLSNVDLSSAVQGFSDEDRRLLATKLPDFSSSDPSKSRAALEYAIEKGLIEGINSEEWQVQKSETNYNVFLSRTGPERLTRVTVPLKPEYKQKLLQNCSPILEISRPDFGDQPYEIYLTVKAGVNGGYESFSVDLDPGVPILAEPLETLALKVYLKDDANATCRLSWNDIFPSKPYKLAPLSNPNMAGLFSLSDDGVATFLSVEFTSSRPPVRLVLFNKSGPEDTNGVQTEASLYPVWNAKENEDELKEALIILRRAAYEALEKTAGGVFQVSADDTNLASKVFGDPKPLDEKQVGDVPDVVPGPFGMDSIKYALEHPSNNGALMPDFVVIGRTGLPADTNYCTEIPDSARQTTSRLVLIDFVPKAASGILTSNSDIVFDGNERPEDVKDAFRRFPAALCPPLDGSPALEHWVLLPDYKSEISWRDDLKVVAKQIFEVK